MVKNPPENMSRITPYLYYNDLASAVEWLAKTFGLKTRMTMPDKAGGLMHAEMEYEDGVVMMGSASEEYKTKSPADLGAVTQGLFIYVDDVDAHYIKAKEEGATITMEPDDMFWGDRMYAALDCEGHHWSFAQHVKDIPPEEMKIPDM